MGFYRKSHLSFASPSSLNTGRSSAAFPSTLFWSCWKETAVHWWTDNVKCLDKRQNSPVFGLPFKHHKPWEKLNGCLSDSGISQNPAVKLTFCKTITTEIGGPWVHQLCSLFITIFNVFTLEKWEDIIWYIILWECRKNNCQVILLGSLGTAQD